jgi:hypothetical protein
MDQLYEHQESNTLLLRANEPLVLFLGKIYNGVIASWIQRGWLEAASRGKKDVDDSF